MNTALIMIGSNYNAETNMELAKEKLSEYFEIVSQSSTLMTKAVGKKYKGDFRNEALSILSDDTSEGTRAMFKQIEKDMGRTHESKAKGEVPIDIDLIFWNEYLVHEDYNRFPFVKKCIDEIKE
jgi:2-amino-4-hydroxy-6-hydroxymethyldihydropteridine diphosphokinase